MIKKAKVQKKSWIREKAKAVFLAKFFKDKDFACICKI
jgi:hypothetical protein